MAAAGFELKLHRLFDTVRFYQKEIILLEQQRDHYKKGMILYKDKYLKQRRIINKIKTMGSSTRSKTEITAKPKLKTLTKPVGIIQSVDVNRSDKDVIGLSNGNATEIQQNPVQSSNNIPLNQTNQKLEQSRKRKLRDMIASDTDLLIESPSKRVCISRRTVELLEKDSEIETLRNQSIQGDSDIDDMYSNADEKQICLLLNTKLIKHLIGKGGHSIKSIRQESNAEINIDTSVIDSYSQICSVSGSASEIVHGVQLIVDKMAEFNQRSPPYQTIILVPEEDVECLLGEYGNGMADIGDETGANVQCRRNITSDSSDCGVLIDGRRESVHYAIDVVLNRLFTGAEKDILEPESSTVTATFDTLIRKEVETIQRVKSFKITFSN